VSKYRARRLRPRKSITIVSGSFYTEEEFNVAVSAVRLARSTGAFLCVPENFSVTTVPGQSRVYVRKADRLRDVNWTVVAPARQGEKYKNE
jgi:hypothetical protein